MLYAYINNPIDAPTNTEPIYTEIGTNFKFWPATLGSAKIIYFKRPADAKWAYTGDLVYDSVNSVQLEWPENDHLDIVYRTLGIIGINLKDGDLIRIDTKKRTLDLLVDENEMAQRRKNFQPVPHKFKRGVLAKYSKVVQSASKGAVCS